MPGRQCAQLRRQRTPEDFSDLIAQGIGPMPGQADHRHRDGLSHRAQPQAEDNSRSPGTSGAVSSSEPSLENYQAGVAGPMSINWPTGAGPDADPGRPSLGSGHDLSGDPRLPGDPGLQSLLADPADGSAAPAAGGHRHGLRRAGWGRRARSGTSPSRNPTAPNMSSCGSVAPFPTGSREDHSPIGLRQTVHFAWVIDGRPGHSSGLRAPRSRSPASGGWVVQVGSRVRRSPSAPRTAQPAASGGAGSRGRPSLACSGLWGTVARGGWGRSWQC